MNYHLNHQGQALGVFPLDELRRRRAVGELTGAELVWCEGMPQWQTLDAVLRGPPPGTATVPPPLPKRESNRVVIAVVAAVFLALLAGAIMWTILAYKAITTVAPETAHAVTHLQPGGVWQTAAMRAASKPVTWTSNTLTHTTWQTIQREFRIRQYLDAYDKCNDHRSSYDADARHLIQQWIDSNYGGKLATNYDALVEQADKLAVDPGCDDPLVWTVLGSNLNEMHEQTRRFDRAVQGYGHSQYKAYPQLYATVMLAKYLVQLGRDHERLPQLDESARQLLKQALHDGSIRPEDQPVFADALLSDWGNDFFYRNGDSIPSIVAGAGDSYHWLALVTEGERQVNAAWKDRGGGYANTVTPAGWKGFREHLVNARENFTKAWQLRPDWGFAANQMIAVSLGDSDISEMRLWFDRTTAAQIDYTGAWKEMRWGLRRRWYGDLDSILAFGITAANTRRYDTDVPENLYYSIADLEEELKEPLGHRLYARSDIWPHLKEMYEGYIAEPSQAPYRDSWRSTYSIVAYLAGKFDVARAQLEALHWQPLRTNFEGWGRDLTIMPLEVAARTGSASQEVRTAEMRYTGGDLPNALRVYQQLHADASLDERTRDFVHERLATMTMEQRLRNGEWVEFLPDSDAMTGWTVAQGKFSRTPDGALEADSGEAGHILFARVPMGNNFEVKGRFEVVRSSNSSFQGGLVFGLPQFKSYTWYGFRVKRNPDEGDVVAFAEGWSTSQLVRSIPLNSQTNSFYMSLHHGLLTARINDQTVFDNANPPDQLQYAQGTSFLGFGAYSDANHTVIRYRDVQVHRLLN